MWPIATTRPVAIDRTRTICCHNINRTSFYNDRNLSIRWRETQRLARCHRSNLIRDTAPAGSRSVVPTVNCQLPPPDLDSFGGTHRRGLQRQPLAGVFDCTACSHELVVPPRSPEASARTASGCASLDMGLRVYTSRGRSGQPPQPRSPSQHGSRQPVSFATPVGTRTM